MLAMPKVFIATLAGLALMRVLERAFVVSFNGAFTLGATACFLVTVANVPVFSIGAPFWAVLIGHIVIALPFCVLLLLPRIASIDKRLEEAAHDLGASGPTTFRRVVLPLILPALLASLIVAFVISIDEVVIASFLIQDQATYPVYLYSGLRLSGQTSLLMPGKTALEKVPYRFRNGTDAPTTPARATGRASSTGRSGRRSAAGATSTARSVQSS